MEWVVQKAVELGVTSIRPILTRYSVVRLDKDRIKKKEKHWQNIAIQACEQCGRNKIPPILETIELSDFLLENNSSLKLILNPRSATKMTEVDHKQEISLLIGPEGGFNDEEILQCEQKGFQSIQLGPRNLRTETAALSALSILQHMAGDL